MDKVTTMLCVPPADSVTLEDENETVRDCVDGLTEEENATEPENPVLFSMAVVLADLPAATPMPTGFAEIVKSGLTIAKSLTVRDRLPPFNAAVTVTV